MPTFLFTDIEGSTARWESAPDAMSAALCRHDSILRESAALHGGRIVKHTGDGIIAVFDNGRALECAIHAQVALQAGDWSGVGGLNVRMCAFAGEAERRGDDYFGPVMNGAARMLSAAWGGQVLANDEAGRTEVLPAGASLLDAGLHILRDLMEPQQIHILTHPSLRSEFPALRTVSSRPQNLPPQPTPFVGRARELDEICAQLEDPSCRLLTILAPGGTGKSRLALQSAARAITGFRHGAFFVRLEDIPSASMIPAAVASAMSLRFSGTSSEEDQLASFLADREVLVVADNFEHLSQDSPVLSRLLSRSPGLKLLVTSRHRLDIREERVFVLRGMDLPAPDGSDLEGCDASDLFLASARRADPGWDASRADRPAIASICRMLEGSPLGIELASSWVRMVPPADIVSELARSFELLDSAPLDMPGRHRGLEAVFEYSWKLLDEEGRRALSGLSIFAGEFDPPAASAVADCGLRNLRSLLDRSLLNCPSPGRFLMHPIVHAYAAEKLSNDPGRREELSERHARHFAAWLEQARQDINRAGSAEVLKQIETALPNLLQAWDRAARLWPPAETRGFLIALSQIFIVRSTTGLALQVFGEKLEIFRSRWGRDLQPDRSGLLANVMERMATFLQLAGRAEDSRLLLEEALTLAAGSGEKDLEPRILGTLGVMEAQGGRHDAARRFFERMLATVEEIGDHRQIAVALTNLATLEAIGGNLMKGVEHYGKALDHARIQGDIIMQMRTLGSMGFMLIHAGEDARALACLEESLEIAREVGDRRAEELSLLGIADLLCREDPERAGRLAGECLRIAESIEHASMQGHALLVLAQVAAFTGRRAEAGSPSKGRRRSSEGSSTSRPGARRTRSGR